MLVVPLARTGITPNQVTFATLPVFLAGAAVLALLPSWGALIAGAAIIELSYVLDCADGQLARLKGTSSPVGAHLDFLMDELKAFALVAADRRPAVAARARSPLAARGARPAWSSVAGAISLTTFVRRPEYAAATGATVSQGTGDYGEGFAPKAAPARRSPLALVEAVGRFIVHYPSHIWLVALVNRMDLFLHAYVVMNAAYAARALLGIMRSLGRKR